MPPENPPWSKAAWPWTELRGIRLEPMFMNHGKIEAPTNNLVSNHPFYTWWWLEKGSVTLTMKAGEQTMPARHWVLIPVGTHRHHRFSADAVLSSISFAARWPNGLPILQLPGLVIQKARPADPLIQSALDAHSAAHTPFASKFISLANRRLSLAESFRFSSALNLFFACLLGQPALHGIARCAPATGDARLDIVLDDLFRHLRAGPLPYAVWKKSTGLSRPHLDRLARASLRLSLREHRDHLLLTEIHRRLSIDHSSIKFHALDLGFVDSAHFCRWVRHQSGLTPKTLVSHRA